MGRVPRLGARPQAQQSIKRLIEMGLQTKPMLKSACRITPALAQ